MVTADKYEVIRMAMCEYLGREPRDLGVLDGVVSVRSDAAPAERRAFWRACRLIGDDVHSCEGCFALNLGTKELVGPMTHRLHCEHVGDDLAMTSTDTNQHQGD
jgi:hypothetical protein